MNWSIRPGSVDGTVRVPGSKSVTHRAYLLAAHAGSRVDGALRSADTQATLDGLKRLGARPNADGSTFEPAQWAAPPAPIDCANSGTTLRLLTALGARLNGTVGFTGDASLRARPNGPLLDALAAHGVHVDGGPTAPYTVTGPLRAGAFRLPASVSSQYASALLLSLPFLEDDSTLQLEAPVASRPYIDITMRMARDAGLRIEESEGENDGAFHIRGGQRLTPGTLHVEADWSTAAFPLVAGAIAGSVTVQGLVRDSVQGDRAILDLLPRFGARVEAKASGVTATAADLHGAGNVDVMATPDLFPALAVLAACAQGVTTFTGGAALRDKESDRIAAMAAGLNRLGVRTEERPDGLVVHGEPDALKPATVDGHHDHRIHMAFALLGLRTGVTVTDAESVGVSYPDFHVDMRRLQGGQ